MPDATATRAPRRHGIDDMPSSDRSLAEIERARPTHRSTEPAYEPGDVEREYALPAPSRPTPTPWQDGEVRIPKPKHGPLEGEAKSLYQMLPLTARVLVRLLDHAAAEVAGRSHTPNNMWCVRLHDLRHALPVTHSEPGEFDKLLFGAIERLEEFKVGCLIPGHHMDRPVIFASRYAHRSMLRSRVLHNPDTIQITRLSDQLVTQAVETLYPDNDAA